MKIAVSATSEGLDAPSSPIFGRCRYLVLVETDTLDCESLPNPAISASGGAGIQAAQYLAGQGIQAVVTGNVGPNAYQVLEAAGISTYLYEGPSVREAVDAFAKGELAKAQGPSARSHSGLGGSSARGHAQRRRH
jgi:predicted Fe-Mo cluster-binding NifX family protein